MATSSVWLIVLAVVVPVLVLALNYYILVYFQHPEDRNTAYAPKVVVVLGLTVAMVTVLLVPFDVANQGEQFGCGALAGISCGDLLGVRWVWQILFLVAALLIVLIIPSTLFFYESFDHKNDTSCKACWAASFSQVFFTIIGVAIFLALYFTLRFAEMPVDNYDAKSTDSVLCPIALQECTGIVLDSSSLSKKLAKNDAVVKIGTPFLVFLPGFLGFVGWFLFSLYAGIGLIALPVDSIRSFIYRPKYMPRDQYTKCKLEIQKKTYELLKIGEDLRSAVRDEPDSMSSKVSFTGLRRRRNEAQVYNEFKQSVVEVEEYYEDIKMCHDNWRVYNPFVPWFKLVWGVLGAVVSLLWILQIILFNLARTPYGPDGVPTAYLLNSMFNAASKGTNLALVGTVLVGYFSFYLLLATMKGQEKFGLRFLIVEIHPIKFGGTYMNSFLVNTSLVLFCVFPLVQFIQSSLSNYVVVTDLDAIFGQQVTFLIFFQVFWKNNVFSIIMMSVAFITLCKTLFFPDDTNMKKSQGMAKRLKALSDQASARDQPPPDSSQPPPPPSSPPPPAPQLAIV